MLSTTTPNDRSVKRAAALGGVVVAAVVGAACTFSPPPVFLLDAFEAVDTAPPEPPCVQGVTTGGNAGISGHTCVPREDGKVLCFGRNAAGQLGDGTTTDRGLPEPVMAPAGIVALAASSQHTCGRTNDGTLFCWGRNLEGQVGVGATSELEATPQMVTLGAAVGPIAAGEGFTCVVIAGGTVKCWGEGSSGQLGDGLESDSLTPVEVTGLTGVVEIGAGEAHACARRSVGEIQCWGRGERGQLGDGMTLQRNTPVVVDGVLDAVDLAVGWNHTCAVVANDVVCWGENGRGQLGTGNINTYAEPQPVAFAEAIDADAIVAGQAHSCVLSADMRVICWGANDHGQLGNDSTSPAQIAPLDPSGLPGWVDVTTGGAHTCARRLDDSSVWCWGEGTWGQLGDGGESDRRVPVHATGLCVAIP
jgi:alpha-tubulin suppressor-like RCC1 family protein